MNDQRLGIWLIDPSGFSPPLFLTEGYPHEKHLEFLKPDDQVVQEIHFYSFTLHITPISDRLPFTYDQDQVIAQAEWSSVQFVKHDDEVDDTWAITDLFLPHTASEAAYGPAILAIPWSFQP